MHFLLLHVICGSLFKIGRVCVWLDGWVCECVSKTHTHTHLHHTVVAIGQTSTED